MISRTLVFVLASVLAFPGLLAAQSGGDEDAGSVADSERTPDASRPNILLVLFDDLGYGEIGVYGQNQRAEQELPHIDTPHLDALAADGLRFTQAYSADPVCAPTRCSLLTGRDQGHAAVRHNWEGTGEQGETWGPEAWEGQFPLPPGTPTIASLLQDAGYATGGFGKWGLGTPLDGGHPLDLGFDHFTGYLCQRQAHNYYPTHLWRDRERLDLDNPPFKAHQPLPEDADPTDPASYEVYRGQQFSVDVITEDAQRFIRAAVEKNQPFFCFYPTPIPHVSLQVPEDEPSLAGYRAAFEGQDPPYTGGAGYLPNLTPRATYAAMISRADRDIGGLLDLLDELGVADNTLVIVTSDNGVASNGGVDREFFASTGLLRGAKASVWEGGIRVPMIVRWPGITPENEVTETVTLSQDILPTLCDALDLEAPPTEGVSLLPALTGNDDAQLEAPYRYWELGEQQALRVGDWKAVRIWNSERTEPGPVQLFNLATDPSEADDLAAGHPEVVAEMEALFETAHTPPLIPKWAFGEEEKVRVAAEGYEPLAAWDDHGYHGNSWDDSEGQLGQ